MGFDKQKLVQSLQAAAKRANRRDFWNSIATDIMKGKVNGIDQKDLRSAKHPQLIAKDIHNYLSQGESAFSKLSDQKKAVYMEVIKIVLDGIGYGGGNGSTLPTRPGPSAA